MSEAIIYTILFVTVNNTRAIMKYLPPKKAAEMARKMVEESSLSKSEIARRSHISRQWINSALDGDHPFVVVKVLRGLGHEAGVAVAFEENKEV